MEVKPPAISPYLNKHLPKGWKVFKNSIGTTRLEVNGVVVLESDTFLVDNISMQKEIRTILNQAEDASTKEIFKAFKKQRKERVAMAEKAMEVWRKGNE